jgi:hypothetical protein
VEEQSVPTMSYSGPKGDSLFLPTVPCSTSAAPGRGEVLEALFTMLPQPMCVFDDRRQLLIANPASAALVGYRVEQLVGEFEWLLLPSDTPRWRRFLRDMHGTNAPRSTFSPPAPQRGLVMGPRGGSGVHRRLRPSDRGHVEGLQHRPLRGPADDLPCGLTRCPPDRIQLPLRIFGARRTDGSRNCRRSAGARAVRVLAFVTVALADLVALEQPPSWDSRDASVLEVPQCGGLPTRSTRVPRCG